MIMSSSHVQAVMSGLATDEIIAAREKMLSTKKTNWFTSEMELLASDLREWLPEDVEQKWLDLEKKRIARKEKALANNS